MNKKEFLNKIKCLCGLETLLRVRFAYRLAKDAHRGQERNELDSNNKKIRYFEHPKEVALILLDVVRCFEWELICACLLHDVFEDGEDPLDEQEIELFLGEHVVSIIKQVSKTPKEGFSERFKKYATWKPVIVKACDRLHNLRTMPKSDNPYSVSFVMKQVRETREIYLPIFEKVLSEPPNKDYYEGSMNLLSQIKLELDKLDKYIWDSSFKVAFKNNDEENEKLFLL